MTELTPITSAIGLPPLVVDLDGTLTPTDTLIESIISLLKQSPLYLFKLVLWLLNGRAAFKRQVASHSHFTPVHLPWRPALLAYLREQHAQNRRLILATAADDSIAQVVAREIGLFDQVIASDGLRNLKGKAKLEAIQQAVGPRFVYAGDSVADLPIWQAAEAAILVGTSDAVRKAVVANGIRIEQEFVQARATWRVWARALRIHQWVKNFLIFVPLLT
ncbi:MAG: haloacid dehalogenase-like hydrolase, partial [Burkholderiaceae bacterium]|nr:haloacid dehalogenase-like hydrolase [Burkholderiaceae bacterium]